MDDNERSVSDYAFISDCRGAALVNRNGSVEWWCTPRFDSEPTFNALLNKGGTHWTIRPRDSFTTRREYVGDSLVLRTTFTTETGSVAVTDALEVSGTSDPHDIGKAASGVLIRIVEGVDGVVPLQFDLSHETNMRLSDSFGENETTFSFDMRAGERRGFAIGPSFIDDVDSAMGATHAAWSTLAETHRNKQPSLTLLRNSIILQGLTHTESGALVAAPTTSLPEAIGEDLNWDYRFGWIRDASFMVRALAASSCSDEAIRLFQWLTRVVPPINDDGVQIMYGVEGERELIETKREWSGFRDSKPVRFGNAAYEQQQLDVLGEAIASAYLLRDSLTPFEDVTRKFLIDLADRAAASWHEPDSGMWEARDRRRHYTSSKVMCWVALDRALQLDSELGIDAATRITWQKAADEVKDAVLERAWCEEINAFGGAFESDHLDASVLLIPLARFLAIDDPRVQSTIDAIERELSTDGLVRRWKGDCAAFILCSFWLVECLAQAGQLEKAQRYYDNCVSCANDLGLMPEMVDPVTKEPLGNFPQAFSHVGWINAEITLRDALAE